MSATSGESRHDHFVCSERHRSFLDRFRIQANGHRPAPGTETTRRVEWAEFRGHFMPIRAARCIDCDAPIVNAVGSIWGVRWADSVDEDRRLVAAHSATSGADS